MSGSDEADKSDEEVIRELAEGDIKESLEQVVQESVEGGVQEADKEALGDEALTLNICIYVLLLLMLLSDKTVYRHAYRTFPLRRCPSMTLKNLKHGA